MKKVFDFFKKKWVIQLIGIIALSLLIWFFGPLISIAGNIPLETVLARLIAILVIILIWVGYQLFVQIHAKRANASMVNELITSKSSADALQVSQESAEEVATLGQNFDAALQLLKQSKSKSSQGSQHLYQLPWYIIIGPPGSGKTTALINSGLEFPLADRFGKNAVQGVGGTRNCDWWFTDQAIMLDTAGRYTTQDSHEAIDKAAWFGFLDLLKKHRPRRPINGAIIAMSLADLLRQTEEERKLHAQVIRQRVMELNDQLGIRVPLYMVFTKGDLIAGFTDFFADLDREERAQVWGVTFPDSDQNEASDVLARIGKDYDNLLARLNARTQKRLQDEKDLQRRNLIFGFPQRMSLLKEPLMVFLQDCFGVNRYQNAAFLRGVYFTSGTQEGTPIDRLMGILANTFRLDRASIPVFSGKGKSYFLERLLKTVIFGEAEITGLNKRVEQRRSLLQKISYASAILLTLIMAAVWSTSFTRNKLAVSSLQEQINDVEKVLAEKSGQNDFVLLGKQMDALYALRDTFPEDAPWSMQFGLYQGNKIQPLVEQTYDKLLKNRFLPMIKARLEQRLSGEEAKNTEILYELLKIYLMLGHPDKMDVKVFRPWIALDFENSYPTDTQQKLVMHLDKLLALPLEPQALDEQLITATRHILTQIPVAQQLYQRIKHDALQQHNADLKLTDVLGPNGAIVYATVTGKLEEQVIPGFFTYNGFYNIFLKDSKDVAKQTVEQKWVLGDVNMADIEDSASLESKLRKYYAMDFIKRWDDLLDNLTMRQGGNLQQSIEILEVISGTESPLRKLLNAVDQQTSLTRVAGAPAADAMDKLKQTAESATGDARMQKLLNAAKLVGINTEAEDDSAREVEQHFEKLTALVKVSGGSAPIDQIIADLGQLYNYMAAMGSTSDTGAAAVNMAAQRSGGNDIISQIQLHSARLPDPIQSLVKTMASGNLSLIMGGVKNQLNRSLQTEVTSLCKNSLEGRYPVAKASPRDVTLQDFGKFFSPNGVLDQFFNSHLKAFVDTSGSQWKVIAQDNKSVDIGPGVLTLFQNAAKIRDVFFQGGGQLPAINFELKPIFLDANASRFWLDLEGQQVDYRHGPARATQFKWPGTAAGLVRFGFESSDGKQVSRSEEGAWALFRLLEKANIQKLEQEKYQITFAIDGLTARYELSANSVYNPFAFDALKNFRCIAGI